MFEPRITFTTVKEICERRFILKNKIIDYLVDAGMEENDAIYLLAEYLEVIEKR